MPRRAVPRCRDGARVRRQSLWDDLQCAAEGGTIFRITPTGELTTVFQFCPQPRCVEESPSNQLIQATNGNFYGTTNGGGTFGDGEVFRLSLDLGPFAQVQPGFGGAAETVRIWGNVAGATGVNFSGTKALFTVLSDSALAATVPVGATTGDVQVVTSSGTLSSKVPFRVLP